MNLIFDLDKEILVSKAGASSKLLRAETKRGDSRNITLTFVRGTAAVVPEGDLTEIIFVAKASASATALPLLLANSWTFNPVLVRWEGVIAQDSALLNDILGGGGSVTALAEVTITTSLIGPLTSQIFLIGIENDLWKGTEGTPLSLPNPESWMEARRNPTPVALGTQSGDVNIDSASGELQQFSANGNATLQVPTNGSAGRKLILWITPTGANRSLDLHTSILRPTDSGVVFAKVLTKDKLYIVQLQHNGSAWMLTTIVGGY